MKFGILVNEGPFTHQASDTAYHFAKAALEKGHEVPRVFFYFDGVNNANKLSEPQSDDRNLVKLWGELAQEHKVDLVVCVAAALRRGIKDEILAEGFRISGLGFPSTLGLVSNLVLVLLQRPDRRPRRTGAIRISSYSSVLAFLPASMIFCAMFAGTES